jgi:hypothetical protein
MEAIDKIGQHASSVHDRALRQNPMPLSAMSPGLPQSAIETTQRALSACLEQGIEPQ